MRYLITSLVACVMVCVAGCGKKEEPKVDGGQKGTVEVSTVTKALSPREAAVQKYVKGSGEFYIYADIADGDKILLNYASELYRNYYSGDGAEVLSMYLNPPSEDMFPKILKALGLENFQAIGASSVRVAGGGYSNSRFLYLPGGRQGLFKVTGGQPRRFDSATLATADTDLLIDADFDYGALLSAVEAALKVVANENAAMLIDGWLAMPAGPTGYTMKEAIEALPRQMVLFMRFGERIDVPADFLYGRLNSEVKIPKPEVVVQIPNLEQQWLDLLMAVSADSLIKEQSGDFTWYRLPTEASLPHGLSPAIVVRESDRSLFVTSNDAWLLQMLSGGAGERLATTDDFKYATAGLPETGNQLAYLSPGFFRGLAEARNATITANPQAGLFWGLYGIQIPLLLLPAEQKPAAMVTTNLEDGILTRANSPLKDSIYNSIIQGGGSGTSAVVMIGGIGTAMAIPGFNKVRQTSQEKAVLNNLRQVASAGQLYILSEGVEQVTYPVLVEKRYFSEIQPIAGEDYSILTVRAEGGVLSVQLRDGRVIEFPY